MAEIVVRALTPALLDDWLAFFDRDAFADNPDWCGCYCYYFHADHSQQDFDSRTASENRAAAVELIRAGRLQGYLAFADGRAVGWCHAAPRGSIPNLADDPALTEDAPERVGSIVCFIVAQAFRRRGVAAALLDAACAGFRERGLDIAEAYPSLAAAGDAANYHGPLSLYLRAGFRQHRDVGERVVVRRELEEADRMNA